MEDLALVKIFLGGIGLFSTASTQHSEIAKKKGLLVALTVSLRGLIALFFLKPVHTQALRLSGAAKVDFRAIGGRRYRRRALRL